MTITAQSLKEMNIQKGATLYILLKASWITLHAAQPESKTGKNILEGTILAIDDDTLHSEVTLAIDDTHQLVASVPTAELPTKGLHVGQKFWAVFDTSSALLAI